VVVVMLILMMLMIMMLLLLPLLLMMIIVVTTRLVMCQGTEDIYEAARADHGAPIRDGEARAVHQADAPVHAG
jgi:hypothetical protein